MVKVAKTKMLSCPKCKKRRKYQLTSTSVLFNLCYYECTYCGSQKSIQR